jgi:RNA polymerase sigma factor (sigma-70 family)
MALSLRSRDTNRAFERLYRAHVGDVYRYALALTGNSADAEDVTQTTFMQVFRALERGERPVKPRNWLIAVTHNVCRQRFRERARQPLQVTYNDDMAEALVPSEDGPTAGDIQRALGQLALNQREALVMRELEGRSYADIAETLELSVSAVETLLFRARRALREQLEGSLTCSEAEAALSLQLDGRLSRADAGLLRGHLRACESCRRLARRQRAQRKAVRGLAAVPVPPGLAIPWLAGGSTSAGLGLGLGVAAKVAAVTAVAAVAGGGTYAVVRHETVAHHPRSQAADVSPVAGSAPKLAPRHEGKPAVHTSARAAQHQFEASGHASVVHADRPIRSSHAAVANVEHLSARKSARTATTRTKPVRKTHAIAAPKGGACRTRPSATTVETVPATTTTTVAGTCPTAQAHGKAHASRP